ncbi:MAG: 3-dehydroquinate synthase [Planctomycetes bacterium]|nr:3-dehydroquinate synthase [Planctomycetota bacterium]MCB9886225.1 3-dehydroquinate synthase [Planctomycetota bacterium]
MITLHCRPPGERPTQVEIGRGLRASLREEVGARPAFLFFDPAAAKATELDDWPQLPWTAGEAGKTLAHCEVLLRAMAHAALDRTGLLLAVGGGVVGDLGGLAASLYLRGIDVWQVPTTLLAMVDSSVGGKTAVNLPEGKNLVGTVYPAQRVFIDIDWLGTLPEQEYRSGLAEVLKVAIGLDRELFDLLERHRSDVLARDPDVMIEVVRRSVTAKIAVVERDPREHGPRRLLNLGHTLGHALEAHSGFTRPHGLCVARGLHFALEVAAQRGAMPRDAAERARALLLAYGFERDALPPTAALQLFLSRDKKVTGDALQFAMPTDIGTSEMQPMALAEIARWLALEPNS